jgi:hypothetical protein
VAIDPPCRRSIRHGDPSGDRGRLRHHGRPAERRRRGFAHRQHAADRRDPGRADHHARPCLGSAFQSGRDACFRAPQHRSRAALPGRCSRTPCSSCRSSSLRRPCAAEPASGSPLAGRPLHHRRLLVHSLDFVRQPGGRIARALSDTFAGIRAADLPGFIVAEFVGALIAMVFAGWLLAEPKPIGHMKAAE